MSGRAQSGILMIMATLVCAGLGSARAVDTVEWTPARVWEGIDPKSEPLEVGVIREWRENGVHYQKVFFTGERVGDARVRVFAIIGTPIAETERASEQTKRPGVLHIHGGGQTASAEWVEFWCQRGYSCVSFDFCGPWHDRTEFTDWGPLKECGMGAKSGGKRSSLLPRESPWFHWALVARRALTLLADQPDVDRERLGIFGISIGGSLCWSVAGTDERVRAAAPIYGCGYTTTNARRQWGFPKLTPEEEMWQRSLSPEVYAPAIKCPVMLLDSTNDFHGWLDFAPRILTEVKGATRASWTPNANHHIAKEQGVDLPAWMDWQLRGGPALPRTPTISIDLDADGVPSCTVVGDTEGAERVDVYYAIGEHAPPNRFWRKIEAARAADKWQATLPVMDALQPIQVFANIYYKRPVCVSSMLQTVVPSKLGLVKTTLKWSERLTIPAGWRYLGAHTDPSVERDYLLPPTADDPSALRFNEAVFDKKIPLQALTNFLTDPQFAPRENDELAFAIEGQLRSGLTVKLISQNWTPASRTYSHVLKKNDVEKRAGKIRLPLQEFRDDNGNAPISWATIDTLQFDGSADAPMTVGDFHWQPRE